MKNFFSLLFFLSLSLAPAQAQNDQRLMYLELPGLTATRGGDEIVNILSPLKEVKRIRFSNELHLAVVETNNGDKASKQAVIRQLNYMQHTCILKAHVPYEKIENKYAMSTLYLRKD